jgi:hypothetical protein
MSRRKMLVVFMAALLIILTASISFSGTITKQGSWHYSNATHSEDIGYVLLIQNRSNAYYLFYMPCSQGPILPMVLAVPIKGGNVLDTDVSKRAKEVWGKLPIPLPF